ncbi:MAG: polyprenyl synthetase family protein [Gammaproteobacteria bacterium]|nr:polyprenyl synthetase family protein [Gammaproteobacteria bacterium]
MTDSTTDSTVEAIMERVEQALDAHLPRTSDIAPNLVEALRYASLGGGKRLRPALVCATAMSLDGNLESALAPAAAVEFLHAYSLIHDDLPAMDDDALRRGRPTCHIAFDEATAILAGDGLQALAFSTLANAETFNAQTRVRMIASLAEAAGWRGMVGGQAFDLATTGAPRLSAEQLQALHAAKTGSLFRASIQLGALAGNRCVDDDLFHHFTRLGETIGLAFQVVDDILDVTQTTETLGKDAGSDVRAGKNTYPVIFGLNESQAIAHNLLDEALHRLEKLGIVEGPLVEITRSTVNRIH